jgi:5-formyltetrahydrofolate cyclo-ligase
MSLDPVHAKAVLRRELREVLRRMPPAEAARESGRLCERLLAETIWREARSVLLYLPLPGEPDVRPVLRAALDAGKTVALPRREPAGDGYGAACVADPGRDLIPGAFGVPEPRPECPGLALNRLDFVLVPGLGFTLDGGRIGRGKGYYDRLLSPVSGFRCGVAFDGQVVAFLPLEPHDARLDCILTPSRWHLTGARARS